MPAEPCPPNGARQTCARSIAICTDTYYLLAATPSSGNQIKLVQGGGFEPPKLARQIYSLIPLATREPLPNEPALSGSQQSLSTEFFNKFTWLQRYIRRIWSWREESNPRPADYKSAALPTELRQQPPATSKRGGGILEKLSCGRNTLTVFL